MSTSESFSGHLLASYMASHTPTGPFGQPLNIATHGPMSFVPSMHGSFGSSFGTQQSFFSESSFMDISQETAKRIATLQAKLDKKLGPEYISQRPGPGGGPKLTYAEGWKIINLANEVFGFNGWSSNVVSITTDFIDHNEESRRFNVGVTAIVRVTLRDGVFHEDVGYGLLENSKSKGAALDKCKKEAVTDAVKRTLRNFGNLLGNCLYDKSYTQEIVKIKVPPPKFDRSELHRRPEFEETKPNLNVHASPPSYAASSISAHTTSVPAAGPSNPVVKSESTSNMPPPPSVTSHHANVAVHKVPAIPHLNRGLSGRAAAVSTPNTKGKAPVVATASTSPSVGLQTPVQTPAGRPAQSTGGDRMAQNLANRHATRLKQIQEAQEAQRKENEEARALAEAAQKASEAEGKRVSFAPAAGTASTATSTSASYTRESIAGTGAGPRVEPTTRPSAPQVLPRSTDTMPDTESDEYHFPSEDDAFLASIDLDALDEGVGRPIDFEEGASLDDHVDGSVAAPAPVHLGVSSTEGQRKPLQQGAAHEQPAGVGGQSTAASATARHAYEEQRARQGHQGQSSKPILGERVRTPSMGGGFSFPSGGGGESNANAPPARAHAHDQNHSSAQARSAPHGSHNVLKRSADAMQGLGPAQQRRPAQGMGLQRAAGANSNINAHAQVGVKREPFATLDVSDGGAVKRPRR